MNPSAIFSKTGKGVQEASGKTSNLSRADRAVLKEIDGKTTHANVAAKFEKIAADKFDALIQQFDKDGYVREVSSGATAPQPPQARSAPPPKAPPPPPAGGSLDDMDFTQAIKLPPKAPPVDLAAAARAESERKAKDQQAFDYKARQEAEAKAKAEAEKKARADAEQRARALAEAKARAEAEAKAKAAAEAKAKADSEGKVLADAEAKVKAAREAAVRMATEAKAKAEAEAKVKADAAAEREREALDKARRESEDKARMQAELTSKLEEERRAREDAERRATEAAERARKDLEEKARRDAEEMRQRLEAEMKAKLEEERKAREEEDRKRREEDDRRRAEEDRKRREEDERRRKEEEERRAKEDAERRAREEEDRKRREEDDRRRKEEDARRAKEEAERRAREEAEREAERKRREEDDRKRAEEEKRRNEEDARRAKEDADRRAKEDADRRAKEDADRRAKDDAARRAKEEAEASARAAPPVPSTPPAASIPPAAVPPPPPPAAAASFGDSLLADLDSFGKREEEEQKAKEEEERKAKEAAARKAKEEADRKAKEEADRKRREEEERKAKEEAERKAKEEEERLAQEEEERKKREDEDRKRKAKEALAAKEAERKAAAQRAASAKQPGKAAKPAPADDDIGVTDDDLDLDDVKKDEKALSATARKAALEREQQQAAASAPVRRPMKWGKPAAIALFVLLIGGVAFLQLMPVSTAEYEKAASDAMGVPVKIGSAHLSVVTGIEARFDAVSIGDSVKIRTVRGFPEVGSLLGGRKSFTRIELEGVSLSQSQVADAVLGKVSNANLRIDRVLAKQVKLDGPLTLPALDVDATVAGDGSLQSVSLRGGDKLTVLLSPKGSDIGFEISAGSLALPFTPGLTLSDFSMKGTANRNGVTAAEFDGRNFDGVFSGTARIRWGANWTVEGETRVRAVRVAVIAPALVSEGRVDGRGVYAMSGPNPATLFESARIQGDFKIDKGVLGSFDLTRALQTGGSQTSGRTVFSELTGQVLYDKGTVKITNASIAAGAMNAGATLDVDANGGLSGRVVADVKTPTQTLRATLNISGKIQEPVIRK